MDFPIKIGGSFHSYVSLPEWFQWFGLGFRFNVSSGNPAPGHTKKTVFQMLAASPSSPNFKKVYINYIIAIHKAWYIDIIYIYRYI